MILIQAMTLFDNSENPHKWISVLSLTFGNDFCFWAATCREKLTVEIITHSTTNETYLTADNSMTGIKHTNCIFIFMLTCYHHRRTCIDTWEDTTLLWKLASQQLPHTFYIPLDLWKTHNSPNKANHQRVVSAWTRRHQQPSLGV